MKDARADAYYGKVASYYDQDAASFEARYAHNPVLQRLRGEFRAASEPYARGCLLEIGYGPGFDLVYWAQRRPDATVCGVDVSPAMQALAERNVRAAGLVNARPVVGTVEDVPRLFPGTRFDLVYCYFGALNTTHDLARTAQLIRSVLAPDGAAVLTFVNRWYLVELIYECLRLRWRRACARLRPVWGGYAAAKPLESRCVSPRDIRHSFGGDFERVLRRGYSILYPAWYRRTRWVRGWPRLCEALWRADGWLNRTPLWSLGEYALYVLRPRPPAR
jgi:SAM-dependent methyltransferase